MMTTPTLGPSDKLAQITSNLFLNAAQAAAMKRDPSAILTIDDDVEEYHTELQSLIDLQQEIQTAHKNKSDYARCIGIVENDLETVNKTIQILQNLMTTTLTLCAIELPHPPKMSGDRKELPNFISKVCMKLIGEDGHFWMTNTNYATSMVI
jgi:hypothetical protein